MSELEGLAAAWPEHSLHLEHFNAFEGLLDPEHEHGFEAVLRDSGLTVTVRPDQTLYQALVDAGIDIGCDCREGLCGGLHKALSVAGNQYDYFSAI